MWCLIVALATGALFISGASALNPYGGGVQDTGLFQLDGDSTGTPYGTLAAAITAAQTSITVNETTAPGATPFTIEIGAEWLTVTARTGAANPRTYTVTRGVNSTTATSHASGAAVILLTPPPQETCGPPDDWAALWHTGPVDGTAPVCSSNGFVFIHDDIGSNGDETYWSQGGSKDSNDPALGPWLWAPNDVSPDKNDLVNAFAASYTVPATSTTSEAKFLMFGSDRFITNGDAQQGFQFLQAETCLQGSSTVSAGGTAACPGSTPTAPTGCSPAFGGTSNVGYFVDPTTGCPIHHKNGDLLILVNFNNGGTLGLAAVYVWFGANGSGAGCYGDLTTCGNPAVIGTGANCATVSDPNKFCSIANTAPLGSEPAWPYQSKVNGKTTTTYDTSAFIEGGVDLSAITGAGSCFPSFLAETRSSAGPSSGLGLTAQLKDLAFGKFQLCGATIATTPSSTSDGNTAIPAAGIQIPAGSTNVDVYDKAVVTVTGTNTFGGNVTFHLCGPKPLTDANYTACTSGGVQIGSATGISGPSPATLVSDVAHLSEVGRYCWRADYSGDSSLGIGAKSDSSVSECFKITPRTPTLTTTPGTSPVTLGSAVTDTATLSSTAYERGSGGPTGSDGSINPSARTTKAKGTITFTLYKSDCSTLATGTGTNPQTVTTVDGDNTYPVGGSVSFIPDAPGTYYWVATYGGDTDTAGNSGAANTNASSATATDAVCSNHSETVTVQKVDTAISTTQKVFPNDSAEVTVPASPDTGKLAGSVKFRLYDSSANCNATTPSDTVGTGGLLYKETQNLSGTLIDETVSTHNYPGTTGNVAVSTNTTVYWLVEFTSTNGAQYGRKSVCAESTQTVFVNDAGPGTQIP